MSKGNIIAGLDIGTSVIKILVAQRTKDSGLEKISLIKEPSFGVRKGVITDPEKVVKTIQVAINKVREECGRKINIFCINIGGSHIFTYSSSSKVAVSRADRKISEEDVKRAIQDAQTFSLPLNKEILEVFSKSFSVDGGEKVKEAAGMDGTKLEAEVLILGAFAPYKKKLEQVITNADIQASDIIPSIMASADAVLTQKQKELGVGLLEIGAGTSSLAVYEGGELIHLVVFPIGSENITNDIAVGLKTDVDIAERIKIEFGSCSSKGNDKKEKIENDDSEVLVFSRKHLARIIEARVSEVFGEVAKELKKISKQGLLPAGIVLTGGGAKLPKITEVAKKELKLSCKMGKQTEISGLEDDSSLATVCGLVLNGIDVKSKERISIGVGGIKEKFVKILKNFVP